MLNRKPQHARVIKYKGFTLVELLLAMVILGVIVVALYGMFSSGLKLDYKARQIHQTYTQARLGFDLLSKELENALNYDFTASYPEQVAFKGEESRIAFIIGDKEGVLRVEYYLGLPDRGKVTKTIIGGKVKKLSKMVLESTEETPLRMLLRRQQPLINFLSGSKEGIQEEVIATGLSVQGFKCQYASTLKEMDPQDLSKSSQEELTWGSSTSGMQVPLGVRVTLTMYDPELGKEGLSLTRDIYLPAGENSQ